MQLLYEYTHISPVSCRHHYNILGKFSVSVLVAVYPTVPTPLEKLEHADRESTEKYLKLQEDHAKECSEKDREIEVLKEKIAEEQSKSLKLSQHVLRTAGGFCWSSIIGSFSDPEVYHESYEKFITYSRISKPGKLVENVTLIRDEEDVISNNKFVKDRVLSLQNISFRRQEDKSDLDTRDKMKLWRDLNSRTPLRKTFEKESVGKKPFFDRCLWNKISIPREIKTDTIHVRDLQLDVDGIISGGLDAELSALRRMGMNRE